MKVIFMGTPEFAVPALEALINAEAYQVVAVYSQPPRPAGRGKKERPSPTHLLAESHGIPVYTPISLKKEETQKAFTELGADIAVVAAYGLLLPEPILKACKYGCINIHPSLLPRWRGAAPIQRTIMAGDTETGVAIMQMDKGLDTGDILLLENVKLSDDITAGELHDMLAGYGAELLLQALDAIGSGTITHRPQSEEGVTYADKIQKSESKIDWSKPAEEIIHTIRGLTPWPGSYFEIDGERIKVLKVQLVDIIGDVQPGEVVDGKLTIACGAGGIRPLQVQRAGRGVMDTDSLLRGFEVPVGAVL